jgi:predicted Zn-dependent protease
MPDTAKMKKKVAMVMREYSKGKLKSGSGGKVKTEQQAKAIAMSEGREGWWLQMKAGLYANIHAKRKRIAEGSKEKMRKPGTEGAPTADAFKKAAKTAMRNKK